MSVIAIRASGHGRSDFRIAKNASRHSLSESAVEIRTAAVLTALRTVLLTRLITLKFRFISLLLHPIPSYTTCASLPALSRAHVQQHQSITVIVKPVNGLEPEDRV